MWDEIYAWIESYAGTSCDVDDGVNYIKDMNKPFTDTYEWRLINEQLIDDLSDIYDVLSENATMIPDKLPSAAKMKQMFGEKVLLGMLEGLNNVKRQLHIQQVDINDYNVLLKHIDVMADLINMLKENSIDTIIEKQMFDKYNEENEDDFINLFGLTSSDMSNMHYTVSSIIESLEDDEDIDEE